MVRAQLFEDCLGGSGECGGVVGSVEDGLCLRGGSVWAKVSGEWGYGEFSAVCLPKVLPVPPDEEVSDGGWIVKGLPCDSCPVFWGEVVKGNQGGCIWGMIWMVGDSDG